MESLFIMESSSSKERFKSLVSGERQGQSNPMQPYPMMLSFT